MLVLFGITMSFGYAVLMIIAIMALSLLITPFFARRPGRLSNIFLLTKLMLACYLTIFAFWPSIFAYLIWNGVQSALMVRKPRKSPLFSFSFSA